MPSELCNHALAVKEGLEVGIRFLVGCYSLIFGCQCIYYDTSKLRRILGPVLLGIGLAAFLFPPYYECANDAKTQYAVKNQRPPIHRLYHPHGDRS
jgi:hypothetical protein